MKNYYFLFCCFFCYSIPSSFATHIIGGSMSYEYLGFQEYKIRLEVLRDCSNGNPSAPFDNPAFIAIYDVNNNVMEELAVPLSGVDDTITINVDNNLCIFPSYICTHKAIYEQNVFLPFSIEGYTVVYQRCCRSQIITNLVNPLTAGMTFHTHIRTFDQNSSPQFKKDVPFAVFANTPFVYDASATDADGDSLVYELNAPFNGADIDDPMPELPLPPPYDPVLFVLPPYSVSNMLGGDFPLTINAETGEMSAIPSTVGVFQIAYSVKEFRDGQEIGTTYREFTFIVTTPAPNQNYDISGTVLIDGLTPLDKGTVQIIERDIATNDLFLYEEQEIATGGAYSFVDIPPGTFYVKAIVDPTSIYGDQYLPTYYKSAAFWYEADPMNQCDSSQLYRDIQLIHIDSLLGTFVLEGYVSVANGNNDPVAELDLILANENGELIQLRSTNSEGYFKFDKLETGSYQIFVDLINSVIDNTNPPSIDLNESMTAQLYLHEDSLELESIATGLPPVLNLEDYPISLYPNPTSDYAILELTLPQDDVFTLKVYDVYGQCVAIPVYNRYLSKETYKMEIDLSSFPEGLYFVEMQSERGGKAIKKMIKQHR